MNTNTFQFVCCGRSLLILMGMHVHLQGIFTLEITPINYTNNFVQLCSV